MIKTSDFKQLRLIDVYKWFILHQQRLTVQMSLDTMMECWIGFRSKFNRWRRIPVISSDVHIYKCSSCYWFNATQQLRIDCPSFISASNSIALLHSIKSIIYWCDQMNGNRSNEIQWLTSLANSFSNWIWNIEKYCSVDSEHTRRKWNYKNATHFSIRSRIFHASKVNCKKSVVCLRSKWTW